MALIKYPKRADKQRQVVHWLRSIPKSMLWVETEDRKRELQKQFPDIADRIMTSAELKEKRV